MGRVITIDVPHTVFTFIILLNRMTFQCIQNNLSTSEKTKKANLLHKTSFLTIINFKYYLLYFVTILTFYKSFIVFLMTNGHLKHIISRRVL